MADDGRYDPDLAKYTADFPDMNHGNPYAVPTLQFDPGWRHAHDITGNDFVSPPGNDQPGPGYQYDPGTGQITYPYPNGYPSSGHPYPVPQSLTGPADDPPDPGSVGFSVNLAAVQNGLDVLLQKLGPAVDKYTEFKNYFKGVEDWVFTAATKEDAGKAVNRLYEHYDTSQGTEYGPPPEKPTFAVNHDQARQSVVGVELTSAAIGNALEIFSQYVGRINDAAQAYKHADNESFK
jgi:hypothetical protein